MVNLNDIIKYFKTSPIPQNMLDRGNLVLNNFVDPIRNLLEQKNVPLEPWTDDQIRFFLQTLSHMDTDKDDKASRVGEREARIASRLHLLTSLGFCHGVGRSGFLTAPQPKAPGGSMMYEITNYLARDFLRKFGLPNVRKAIVTPICTGMTLALCLGALKPDWKNTTLLRKRTVLLPQVDHKSILKAIDLMGMYPKVVEGQVFGDAVRVPVEDIVNSYDKDCFAVLSITSFFPPRESDDIKEISKFAKEKDLVHIVVNAYGVQSPEWMKFIRAGIDAGRVDAIIQSTDKNVLTPIGGAIIATPQKDTIAKISQAYAGRASATPIVNFLISMLSLGVRGYGRMLEEQRNNRKLLEDKLKALAIKLNEKVLKIFNPVAVAMSLNHLKDEQRTALGGALYNLRVTGPRVYDPKQEMFGTCSARYKQPYIVMNAAIGAKSEDIVRAVERLEKAYSQMLKK